MLQAIARSTIKHLPAGLGFRATRVLAARPPTRASIAEHETKALLPAERMPDLGWSGNAVWSWGRGPNVVLAHGWGGRAAQMAPLAAHIAHLGFRTIVYDAAAHGDSAEPEARWEYLIRDAGSIAHGVGDVTAWIGHSAGGLAMMAARRTAGVRAHKYICICAPSHPYPPIRGIAQRLDPGPRVIERYKTYLGQQFQTSWDELAGGWAFAGAGANLLLCYDRKDRFIDHSEGDRIHGLCPGSRLVKTAALGHVRILSSPELFKTVETFLA